MYTENNGGYPVPVGVEDLIINPTMYYLSQNYPNPFNPTTRIQYKIGNMQFVTLKVYDLLGNEIAILIDEEQRAGNYEIEFNAAPSSGNLSANGRNLTSGIYFYQLKAGSFVETKKMLLLK